MAVKQRGAATKADEGRTGSSVPADVIAAVSDIVAASAGGCRAGAQGQSARRRAIEAGAVERDIGRQLEAAACRPKPKATPPVGTGCSRSSPSAKAGRRREAPPP